MAEENEKMRLMFEGAIKLQEDLIADSQRRIEHYRWAISEMAKHDDEALMIVSVV